MMRFLTALLSVLCLTNLRAASVIGEGDSIMAGWYATGFTSGRTDMAGSNCITLMNLPATYGTTVTNCGHGGDAVEYEYQATDALASLTNYSAQAKQTVLFYFGHNDIAHSLSIAQITNYCYAWTTNVRASFPSAFLTCITLHKINYGDGGTMEGKRLQLNDWFRTNHAGFDSVVDMAADPIFQDYDNTTYYYGDKVHLNDPAYLVMANWIKTNLLASERLDLDTPANSTLSVGALNVVNAVFGP